MQYLVFDANVTQRWRRVKEFVDKKPATKNGGLIPQETSFANFVGELRTLPCEVSVVRKV